MCIYKNLPVKRSDGTSGLWGSTGITPKSNRQQSQITGDKKAEQSTKESTPPVLRSAPSSSGVPTSLGIRRSSSARKRSIASGRSGSKSKRFSTTR